MWYAWSPLKYTYACISHFSHRSLSCFSLVLYWPPRLRQYLILFRLYAPFRSVYRSININIKCLRGCLLSNILCFTSIVLLLLHAFNRRSYLQRSILKWCFIGSSSSFDKSLNIKYVSVRPFGRKCVWVRLSLKSWWKESEKDKKKTSWNNRKLK